MAVAAAALLLVAGMARAAESEDARFYQESYAREQVSDFAGAIAVLERASKASQESYFHQLRLGWLRYLAGEHGDSVAAYERAVALEPAAVEPYLGLLLPQLAGRAWLPAEKTARAALERDPGSYLARSRLAWVLFSQGRHAEAEGVYRGVLALYPADLEMRSGLGWALLRQGKHRDAEAELRRVLAVSPGYASARSALEEIGRATGERDM
jgi:tetratricopeptide (TPR) repeat protein